MRDFARRSTSWLAYLILVGTFMIDAAGCGPVKPDPATEAATFIRKGDEPATNGGGVDVEPTEPQGGNTATEADGTSGGITGSDSEFVRLGTLPKLKLTHTRKATAQEAEEIKQLIRQLAEIDGPDFGLSGTMSGGAFSPIDGMSSTATMILVGPQLKTSPALRRLVELGPKSLPFLLDALDDKTPTKLVMKHGGDFGVMAFTNELWGNPVNSIEQRVLVARPQSPSLNWEHVSAYTVKVGDVCLVAIGQIVGRGYQAVRYQPTACIMLNSPTHDAKLCRQVREIWSSQDFARTLFESLLLDYATEGVFNGKSLDGWALGSNLQVDAAMRLLYYFPAESADLIAGRLDRLDVRAHGPGNGSLHSEEELDGSMKQCVANGVRADEFVKAVAWCEQPEIKAAMLRVFDRATDPDVVVASMRSVGPDDRMKVVNRVAKMIDGLPEDDGIFGDGYNLLVALGEYGGADSEPVFRKYFRPRTIQRCLTACNALREVRGDWVASLLAPLLDDRRGADGREYAVHPTQDEPRLRIRICDEAAETIAASNRNLHFELRGTHADLDRQIKVIQAELKRSRK